MAGFWEQLLDYFTRVDDILRETLDEYKKGNARLIEAITGVEPEPDIPRRHIPFYADGDSTPDIDLFLYIKDDAEQGLGVVGRSGFISNDGADSLYITIDDGTGKSGQIRIDGGERLVIARDANIWVDTVTLLSTARAPVAYRCLFSG